MILAMPGGEGIEVEEGYVTSLQHPFGLGLRVGKFKVPFGRENAQHTHALPFIDRSLVGDAIFGEKGLNEVGIEASYLIPTPWYSLISLMLLNGNNELLFDSPDAGDVAVAGDLSNVFDLSVNTTVELGLSMTAGRRGEAGTSEAAGARLVYKWRPVNNANRRGAVVVLEAMWAHPAGSDDSANEPTGAYAYAQWRLARRWYVAGRYDILGEDAHLDRPTQRGTLILTLAPTEFSALRLQTASTILPDGDRDLSAFLQLNITIGAHPAHAY